MLRQYLDWRNLELPSFTKEFLWDAQCYFVLPFEAVLSTFIGVLSTVCQQKFVVTAPMIHELNDLSTTHRLNLFTVSFHRSQSGYSPLLETFLKPLDNLHQEKKLQTTHYPLYISDISYDELLSLFINYNTSCISFIDYTPTILEQCRKDRRLYHFLLKGFDNSPTRLFNREKKKIVSINPLVSIAMYIPFLPMEIRNFFFDTEFMSRTLPFFSSIPTFRDEYIDENGWSVILQQYRSRLYAIADFQDKSNNNLSVIKLSEKALEMYEQYILQLRDVDYGVHPALSGWFDHSAYMLVKLAALLYLFENGNNLNNNSFVIPYEYMVMAHFIIRHCLITLTMIYKQYITVTDITIYSKIYQKCRKILLDITKPFKDPFTSRDLQRACKIDANKAKIIIKLMIEERLIRPYKVETDVKTKGRKKGLRFKIIYPVYLLRRGC